MRIIALLSFYDENPAWLTRCVTSLTKIPVDEIVALDGPYQLYGGPPRSGRDQYDAIHHGPIPATVHHGGWEGNEIEKRNHLFTLAEETASPDDWYIVIDADEEVSDTRHNENLHQLLSETVFDVATVHLREPGHPQGTMIFPTFPMFFRAIPGLRCITNHYTYQTPDGRKLWGNAKTDRLEPRQATQVAVNHYSQLRHPDRRQAALTYYRTRDEQGIEDIPEDRTRLAVPEVLQNATYSQALTIHRQIEADMGIAP